MGRQPMCLYGNCPYHRSISHDTLRLDSTAYVVKTRMVGWFLRVQEMPAPD